MPGKNETRSRKGKNEEDPGEVWILSLYVAGQTPNSLRAFDNLKKMKRFLEEAALQL